MSRLLTRLDRALGAIAAAFAIAGGSALLVLTAVTGVAVFYRYVLRAPIFGIEDVSTMALTLIVAGAVAWAAVHRGHVSVNLIAMAFGGHVTRVTDLIARALSCSVLVLASYALFLKGSCGLACGAITSNLEILHTPFYYALGASLALFAALTLTHLAIGLLHWHGDDPNEAQD